MIEPNESIGRSSIATALHWVETLLVAQLASCVAILAVASLGLLMLTGRLPLRRAATVIIGCFILFSASLLGQALVALTGDASQPRRTALDSEPSYTPSVPKPASPDPYAGASVPTQRTQDLPSH